MHARFVLLLRNTKTKSAWFLVTKTKGTHKENWSKKCGNEKKYFEPVRCWVIHSFSAYSSDAFLLNQGGFPHWLKLERHAIHDFGPWLEELYPEIVIWPLLAIPEKRCMGAEKGLKASPIVPRLEGAFDSFWNVISTYVTGWRHGLSRFVYGEGPFVCEEEERPVLWSKRESLSSGTLL